MNEEIKHGQPASLEKFKTNPHFSKPYKLVYEENLVHSVYEQVVSKYNDLELKRKQFWKLEGRIYLIAFAISVLGLIVL